MFKNNLYDYAPDIQVGTVFKRVDKNGKVWEAKVIKRTDYFVEVEKTQPYQIKVADEEYGNIGMWHYEDAKPTYERCQINQQFVEVETGEFKDSIWGGKVPVTKRVGTNKFYIFCKEVYSKYPNYDKTYTYTAPIDCEPIDESLKKWFEYCETNDPKVFDKEGE